MREIFGWLVTPYLHYLEDATAELEQDSSGKSLEIELHYGGKKREFRVYFKKDVESIELHMEQLPDVVSRRDTEIDQAPVGGKLFNAFTDTLFNALAKNMKSRVPARVPDENGCYPYYVVTLALTDGNVIKMKCRKDVSEFVEEVKANLARWKR